MRVCSFCNQRDSAAVTDDKSIGCCKVCAGANGPARKLIQDACGTGADDIGPMLPSGLGGAAAEMNLLAAAAKKARRTAKREGRPLYGAELSLSLSETAARQRIATAARTRTPRRGKVANTKDLARRLAKKTGYDVA
jgi:hypothetical protein